MATAKKKGPAAKGKGAGKKASPAQSTTGRPKKKAALAAPLSLEVLGKQKALDGFKAPAEAFDPDGAWHNTYQLWLAAPADRADIGCLDLKRTPKPDGQGATLEVDLSVVQTPGVVERTRATIECAGDALATPQSWTLKSNIVDAKGKPIQLTEWSEKATVRDGAAEGEGNGRKLRREFPARSTSDWSILDAVQRLDGEKTKPLEFALIEGLQLVKPGQRLSFRQPATLALGDGSSLNLAEYQQLGDGILPTLYYVDEHGRLLFLISGVHALIYRPDALDRMTKVLESLAGREEDDDNEE